MLVGTAFVLDVTIESFTPAGGNETFFKRAKVSFLGENGHYGDQVTMTASMDVEFGVKGDYQVTLEPRVRDGKVSFRIVQLMAIADVLASVKKALKEAPAF